MKRLLALVAMTVFAACSSVETPPAASGASAGRPNGGAVINNPADGGGGGVDDGGNTICTTLTESGTLVDVVAIAGEPPAAVGGTLVDGSYVLTGDDVYVGLAGTPGPLGTAIRSSIRISNTGTAMERVLDSVDTNNKTTSRVEVLSLSATATNLLLNTTCPSNGQTASTQYTTDGTNLFITDPVSKERRSYQLR